MKLKFSFILVPALLGLGCSRAVPGATAEDGGDAERLVALLDYVGGDYGRAVQAGRVVSQLEYDEQRRFVEDCEALARALTPDATPDDVLAARLRELKARVEGLADAAEVLSTSRAARDEVVRRFDLRTVPFARPSLDRAQASYASNCAACHGADGEGDTERARSLDPAPARFRDPERLASLSPYRVYNALSFGVQGTAMAAFDALSPQERWSLAFYVFRLGHEGRESEPGKLPLAELARLSDGELLWALQARGEPRPARVVTHLRRETPFEPAPAGATAERAQRLVAEAVAAHAARRPLDAQRLAIDAYLLGFEPLEPQLQARDPRLVARVEAAFGALRAALADEDPGPVRARADELLALLFGVAEGDGRRTLPFLAGLMIYFREGIEAALIVGALLATLRKLGRPEAARSVHAGWLLALPAGVATWWVFDRVLSLGAGRRELVEASVALLAAGVLFSVSFWLVSRAESRRWMGYLRQSVERSVSRPGLWALASLAFLAAYREAAETVLFTRALLLYSEGSGVQVALGAASGTLLAVAAAFLMNRTVRSLPLGPFFAVSGALLCLLAISFAGAGIYGLVRAGYLPARPVPFPELPWIGVHPDLTALVVQLVIVGVIAAAGLVTLRRGGEGAPS